MKLSFVGDVCLAGIFKNKVRGEKLGHKILSDEILQLFASSDYTICNLEGPVTEEKCVLSTKLNVKSPKDSIPYLQQNNINVFGLANNHMFDAQYEGFEDTRKELIKYNAPYFGAGDNLNQASEICYLKKDEITIAVIGVGHNVGEVADKEKAGIFSYTSEIILKEKILEAKRYANWVVVFCHAGPEYNFYPTPTVCNRMKNIISMGADIIVGHHPHVIQGYEFLENNKLIVYSLGNFIFDLKSTRNKSGHDIGIIASITFDKETFTLETQPVKIDTSNGVVSFAPKEYVEKLQKISDFSDYDKKMAKEALRCVFFNPILPKELSIKTFVYVVSYPIVLLYKAYLARAYDREFVDIILKYYKLSFLKIFLRHDEFYKSK